MPSTLIKILVCALVLVLISVAVILYRGNNFYDSVFRLSYAEITTSVGNNSSQCKKFKDCTLQPGDIIIRRYVTNASELFNDLLDPYFTHSAIYLGNDELFEALGTNESPENQIRITKLSERDWLAEDMNTFIIMRPKIRTETIDNVILELKNIANDPEYTFGIWDESKKKASCSDAIFKYLEKNGIISISSNIPTIITPDYLYWITKNDTAMFQIVGYNLTPRN